MPDLRQSQLLQSAVRCFTEGDLAQADGLARQSLRASRKDVEALGLLGQIAQRRNLFEEAEGLFRQCVTLKPKVAVGHLFLGMALTRQGRHREAIARFDRALKLEPGMPRAIGAKADTYVVQGQYERARAVLGLALNAGVDEPGLAAVLAEVELNTGNPEAAITIGAPLVESEAMTSGVRYRLGSTLGKAYERVGDYDKAFEAFDWGNRGIPINFDRAGYAGHFDAIIETCSAERLATLPRAADRTALPVLIVGMPRSGSTLVERIIASHPQAHGAGEIGLVYHAVETLGWNIGSDLPYPGCIADLGQKDVDRLGRIHVEALEKLGRAATRVVDKNLGNYQHLGLLSLMLPGARVIHCRRDPLDTCISCFGESLGPSVYPFATDLANLGHAYRQYDRLMRHWASVLDIDVLDVAYEETVADQEAASRRIIDFCGLEWDDRCLRFHESKQKVLTLSYEQVRRPIYSSSIGRAGRFEKHLGPLREALGDLAGAAGHAGNG